MAQVIPADAHQIGDPNHTPDHNNIADMLALLTQALAIEAGTSPGTIPASNATNVTALQAAVTAWSGYNSGSYQYYPEAYGAYGDGKIITDATMLTSSSLLNSSSQASFTSADIGKDVLMSCTGGGIYTPSHGTITGVNSATQAVVSFTSTSATPGNSICIYGHDDTAAVCSAVTAAYNAWNANKRLLPTVFLSQKIYCLGGTTSPVNKTAATGAGQGNALIPLPIIPTTGEKMTLVFQGVPDSTGLLHWQEQIPQTSGPVLCCLRTDGTLDATYGPASVIGGPFNGYGASSSTFSNMITVIDGIEIMIPYNGTYGGFDFWGVAEANVMNGAVMAAGIVPAGPPYPSQGTTTNLVNSTIGLRMPSYNNNDDAVVLVYACEGLSVGFAPGEHTIALSVRCINCGTGIQAYSGHNSGGYWHGARIDYASVENSFNAIGVPAGDSYPIKLDIGMLDIETISGNLVNDASNWLAGTIGFVGIAGTATNLTGYLPNNHSTGVQVSGGANLKLVCLSQTPGAITSPQAAPANNTAWPNYYYRDAWITLSATTITAVLIGTVAQNGLASSPATYGFMLPAGQSYTPTFTGSLTHTVSLL